MIHFDAKKSEWVGQESGNREYAHTELLSTDGDGIVTYGYDGDIYLDDFTLNERRALADLMITRWTKWKEEQK